MDQVAEIMPPRGAEHRYLALASPCGARQRLHAWRIGGDWYARLEVRSDGEWHPCSETSQADSYTAACCEHL